MILFNIYPCSYTITLKINKENPSYKTAKARKHWIRKYFIKCLDQSTYAELVDNTAIAKDYTKLDVLIEVWLADHNIIHCIEF